MLALGHSRRDTNLSNPFHAPDSSFADMEFDWPQSDSFSHLNPFYPYNTDQKPQMKRTASSNSVFAAPGLMPSSDSNRSASSSTVGSPYSGPMQMVSQQESFNTNAYPMHGLGMTPAIVGQDTFQQDYNHMSENELLGYTGFENDKMPGSFVDPTLIASGAYADPSMYDMQHAGFSNSSPVPSPGAPATQMAYPHFSQPASPTPSQPQWAYPAQLQQSFTNSTFVQQPYEMVRRPSMHSFSSVASHASPGSDMNEDGEKRRCPFPECGKVFKDLKAHMLTHQSERPEKCPIASCEYHTKGFARKYDKNRHTLTHYKGTMVCSFCPDTGTSAEKTFNRADVFKRHLTSVHGVEQTPPNSRKRSPAAGSKKADPFRQENSGKCSTCQVIFSNAQDFYEHLDDCVLRMVQQVEPSEEINASHLTAIGNDKNVQETFDRHMIRMEDNPTNFEGDDEDDDEEEDDDDDDEDTSYSGRNLRNGTKSGKTSGRVVINGAITKKTNKKGLTWSQGGVPLTGKGRKKRKDYPPAWGMNADKMRMKRRTTCIFDGPRRLAKDELMLNNEFEVRMPLPGGQGYITDLDVETLNRAEGFLNATEAEKGPWDFEEMGQQQVDLTELMRLG